MVYVDPDPEIGSPSLPSTWTQPSTARSGESESLPGDRSGGADQPEHQAAEHLARHAGDTTGGVTAERAPAFNRLAHAWARRGQVDPHPDAGTAAVGAQGNEMDSPAEAQAKASSPTTTGPELDVAASDRAASDTPGETGGDQVEVAMDPTEPLGRTVPQDHRSVAPPGAAPVPPSEPPDADAGRGPVGGDGTPDDPAFGQIATPSATGSTEGAGPELGLAAPDVALPGSSDATQSSAPSPVSPVGHSTDASGSTGARETSQPNVDAADGDRQEATPENEKSKAHPAGPDHSAMTATDQTARWSRLVGGEHPEAHAGSRPPTLRADHQGTVEQAWSARAVSGRSSGAMGDVSEGSSRSLGEEVPWSEPALPGAWPSAATTSDPEQDARFDDDGADPDGVPQPDPAWPRLFGQPPDAAGDQQHGGLPEGRRHHDTPADEMAQARTGGDSGEPWFSTADDGPARGTTGGDRFPVPSQRGDIGTEPAGPGEQGGEEDRRQGPPANSVESVGGKDDAGQGSMSAAAPVVDAGRVDSPPNPASPQSADVSRETSVGGGGQMHPGRDEDEVEDEAAVAVREAVSRAAAEAGVDVSRETDLAAVPNAPLDVLGGEPIIDRESAAKNARVTFRIDRDALNGARRVVAVANQKGGVGKSTTAVNIGAYLALAGARVLVVDLDPQGNASTGLGLDHRDIEPSIYDVLTGEAPLTAAIRATGVANLHVLPSTIDLAGAEVELVSAMSRETRLRRALESIDKQYDTVLIDCPPSLGLLTVNALAAADELLIPIQCEYYALEGLGQLLRNVELVRANLNPELRIGGIVLTMYDSRTRLALQVVDEVRRHFSDVVYQTVVPRSVRLSEAPGYGVPIALYDPLSRGGIAYRDLTFELAERSGLLAPTGEGAS
jgi:chromosome partitioning protein